MSYNHSFVGMKNVFKPTYNYFVRTHTWKEREEGEYAFLK